MRNKVETHKPKGMEKYRMIKIFMFDQDVSCLPANSKNLSLT
ncbi:hypothetical protein [Wolbachia endosymbiont of Nilaparvata lugens]|nr:hypothetical protein [Wolbachia endosymbiont of Nilaparvata lugens]